MPEKMKPDEGMPDMGWNGEAMFTLAIIEIVGGVLYLIPYTSLLGAIVLTGYLGGAVATHLRMGDAFAFPLIFGMLLWLGLVLRDARLRGMLPFRSVSSEPAGPSGCLSFIGVCLLTLILVAGVIFGIAMALPTHYHIARSVTIDAPPSQVFANVVDFNKWKPWNPWTEGDPDIKIAIEGKPGEVGSIYKWSGNYKVGAGSMTITEIVPNEHIKINLEFDAPMKKAADSEFVFKAENGKTNVTWLLDGDSDMADKALRAVMPMEMVIGGTYLKGLKKLKTVVESENKAPSHTDTPKDK
jgi:uncharacterized protein YndB with AHSA1/START domain